MSEFSWFDEYDKVMQARDEYTATINIDTLNEDLYIDSLARDYENPHERALKYFYVMNEKYIDDESLDPESAFIELAGIAFLSDDYYKQCTLAMRRYYFKHKSQDKGNVILIFFLEKIYELSMYYKVEELGKEEINKMFSFLVALAYEVTDSKFLIEKSYNYNHDIHPLDVDSRDLLYSYFWRVYIIN